MRPSGWALIRSRCCCKKWSQDTHARRDDPWGRGEKAASTPETRALRTPGLDVQTPG